MHALSPQILKGVKPPLNAVFGRNLPHRQWGTCKKVRNRVGLTGIEPALPKELDPKSSKSASSATARELAFQYLPPSVPDSIDGSSPFSKEAGSYSEIAGRLDQLNLLASP